MEIQEKPWVYEFPGTKVQDDDLPYVSFVLSLCNEVKSSVTNQNKANTSAGSCVCPVNYCQVLSVYLLMKSLG